MEKIHVYLNIKEKYIPTDFKYIQIYNKESMMIIIEIIK